MAGNTAVMPEAIKVIKAPRLFASKKFTERFTTVVSTALILFGLVFIMVPVVWMVSTSLKTSSNFNALPPEIVPLEGEHIQINGTDYVMYDVNIDGQMKKLAMVKLGPEMTQFIDPANPSVIIQAPTKGASIHRNVVLHFENYVTAWLYKGIGFQVYIWNTFKYSVWAVLAEVLINSFVAFGFARLRAPFRNTLFIIVLATMMLPYPVTMIPSFVLFTKYIPDFLNGFLGAGAVKLADTWWPLYLPKLFGSAYLIFLIRQFYMTIPRDYDEAARIDGASFVGTWARIILPMSQPTLVAVAVLSFMYHWNDYLGPLIYLNTTTNYPLSVGLANFQAMYGGTPWHLMMAASVIAVTPLVVIFFALNRYFIQGVVVSGIKG